MLKLIVLPMMMLALASEATTCATDSTQTAQDGAVETHAIVQKTPEGLTIEQQNVRDRLQADNMPGSIKHLYVISAYSGQVLIYSTVRGKVTSSGKRLGSTSEAWSGDHYGFYSPEVIGDDGTYGQSVPYIYWWDTKGVYHQHYPEGGQIIHISSEPLAVKSIVINMELQP